MLNVNGILGFPFLRGIWIYLDEFGLKMPETLPYATHDFLIDEEFHYILDHMNTGSDRVIMRDKLSYSV